MELDELDERDALRGLLPALDGRPGPATRLSSTRQQALARLIVDAAAAPTATDGPPPATARPAHPRATTRWLAAVLVAALVGSAAALVTSRWLAPASPPPASPSPAVTIAPDLAAPPVAGPAVVAPPPAPAVVAPTTITTPPAPPAVAPAPATAPVAPPRRPLPRAATAPTSPPPTTVTAPAPAVADLLAQASARRRARAWADADALYRQAAHATDDAGTAAVATVASASLRLEHLGDPAGARRAYQRALALAPTGAVAEEARWGLVECARAVGDAAGERRDLAGFLARHPGSALADAARRRLTELGP